MPCAAESYYLIQYHPVVARQDAHDEAQTDAMASQFLGTGQVHPRGDREKIAALRADMVRAFMDGDLDAYWKLDRELRWLLAQGKSREH